MKNNKKLGYLLIAFLSVVLIGFLILTIFIKTNKSTFDTKKYSQVQIPNFKRNYINGTDFLIENTIQIQQSETTVFKPNVNRFFVDKTVINLKAKQLGLENANSNLFTEIYYWSKTKDISSEVIELNEKKRTFNFRYSGGINSSPVSDEDAYEYVTNFFGLNLINSKLQDTIQGGTNIKTLIYRGLVNDRDVFLGTGNDISTSIVVNNGKIVGASISLTPSDLSKDVELKPLRNIDSSNISSLAYIVNFEDIYSKTDTDYTAGLPLGTDTKVVLNSYKEVFYNYFDENNTYLLPALSISGEYIDSKNNKGNLTLIVINQNPF